MTPADIAALIDDRISEGVFRVHSSIFRREDIFELEQKYIFEKNWVFIGLECQIPKPNDFFVSYIGRQSVIVSRDKDGKLHCFLNSCRHRGSIICNVMSGNKAVHTCPYHAWAYDSAGRNVAIPAREQGGYSPAFDNDDHGLRKVARFENYRGFLFASLDDDVQPLTERLGQIRTFIDLAVDQSEEGLELVPGVVRYMCHGNWKFLLENSADGYHFLPTHQSYFNILAKRRQENGGAAFFSQSRQTRPETRPAYGSWTFPNGHNAAWAEEEPGQRPIDLYKDSVRSRVGDVRAKWMGFTRVTLVFPNLMLLEAPVLQVRIFRPLNPDRTEITAFCIAPKGEPREARMKRLRIYEEFYNPAGLATPDDLINLSSCQAGPQSDLAGWHQGYMRGIGSPVTEVDHAASELNLTPLPAPLSTDRLFEETIFHGPLREWRHLLMTGLRSDNGHGAPAEPAR